MTSEILDFEDEDEDEDEDEVPTVVGPKGIRVLARRCDTCVFNPGNRMHLMPGRLASLVQQIRARRSHLICHSTLPGISKEPIQAAICRGYADAYGDEVRVLQLGRAMDFVEEVEPPETHLSVDISPLGDDVVRHDKDRGEEEQRDQHGLRHAVHNQPCHEPDKDGEEDGASRDHEAS